MISGRTSLVVNGIDSKFANLEPFYYRIRNCDTNMNSNTPANKYQIQKIIQNTVRVPTSEYIMNKAALTTYVSPSKITYYVCWNQQSDRPVPSVQKATIPTGTNTSLNGKHTSHTSSRPGCQTPGGAGCDIKHNSYDRYLNRLKGKKVLRRGVVPSTFGSPVIPFNQAYPVYGGKQFKTAIINGCNCPYSNNPNADSIIYNNSSFDSINNVIFKYTVGTYVYAVQNPSVGDVKAQIIQVIGANQFIIQFEDGTISNVYSNQIKLYFPCTNCN